MVFPIEIDGDIVSIVPKDENVDHEEVMETMNFILNNPSLYLNKKLLIIDPESHYQPGKKELEQFVSIIKSILSETIIKAALVATRDLHYGLGRMLELLTGPRKGEFQVFRNKEDAVKWLRK